VACGDSLNDVDMLEWAGRCAVAKARPWRARRPNLVMPRDELGKLFAELADGA